MHAATSRRIGVVHSLDGHCAFLLRRRDPLPTRRRYDWEDEEPVDGTEDSRGELFFDRPGPDDERRF